MPAIQARVAMMPGRSNRPMKSLHTRGSVMGCGIGSVLLDGGNGLASSYRGIEDYVKTTGNPIKGAGLSDKLKSKMENLIIKPSARKPKNINFSL